MKNLIKSKQKSLMILLCLSVIWIYSSVKAGNEIWNNSDYMSHEFTNMDPGLGALLGTSAIIIIPFCVIAVFVLLSIYLLFQLIINSPRIPLVVCALCFLLSVIIGVYDFYDTVHVSMNYYLWKLFWSIIAEIIYSIMVVISIINLGLTLKNKVKKYMIESFEGLTSDNTVFTLRVHTA